LSVQNSYLFRESTEFKVGSNFSEDGFMQRQTSFPVIIVAALLASLPLAVAFADKPSSGEALGPMPKEASSYVTGEVPPVPSVAVANVLGETPADTPAPSSDNPAPSDVNPPAKGQTQQVKDAQKPALFGLLSAYDGEIGAMNKYRAFATVADQEGFAQIAVMYRAAAAAEEHHANSNAAATKEIGGTPQADNHDTPAAMLTKENLQQTIQGELEEWSRKYAQFALLCQMEGVTTGMRALTYAQAVEGIHAMLFSQALNDMESMKTKTTDYYVCPVCGFTTPKLPGAQCPVCDTNTSIFITIQ